MKIAITGATGQLGNLVIEQLLQLTAAQNIVALVRKIDKAEHFKVQGIEPREFDYDRPETLVPALLGIDKLLLISANEIGRRTPQHQAVIDAAKVAGVPYLAYTSLLRADTSPLGLAQEHRETEKLIQDSGITYTFLRNNWYSENYLADVAHTIEIGTLFGAAQDGRISSASRIDYAEAAAKVLTSTGHENKTYELAGSESFSLSDLATFIGQAVNKDIIYQNLSAEEYTQGLTQAGLPAGLVDVIVDADIQTIQGAMYTDSKDLEQLIGHKTTSIQDSIKAAL
ncbi:SDR family oxidoreductase [Acinetobacter johnsonii]|uniref:SDR family oxidoreductase n=1 Tax=Acinetobacter johnsonii TaxID=40214 RepID=A0AA42MV23_ACIJO|nr:SDR family oxidoreductase [Acinetobacter johnsonii]MDH0969631.1 SDR family oxidoreductase [Acinetobacter johnsonii]MDH1699257.1 SDR family oxidoreductase [Acinetobacter johnsonii]